MKSNVLLIANRDGSANKTVAAAAAETARGLCHAKESREAFEILGDDLNNIDIVIIDLDPGVHSLSILEALSYCKSAPPVIVVTGLEEADMAPVARRHGAAACIGKPFPSSQLASLIEDVCTAAYSHPTSSDAWGHPWPVHVQIIENRMT